MRFLTEASGSLTAGYLQKAIQQAGYVSVASDVHEHTCAACLSDDFIMLPTKDDPALWEEVERLLRHHRIDVVIPTFDEMMGGWAKRKRALRLDGVEVIISDEEVINTFQDKWLTYQFFRRNGIPTPETSLRQEYGLIKPRMGRGSAGVRMTDDLVDMNGMISQAIVPGQEYTIDVFCDHEGKPTYIVPRKRLRVSEGKSVCGITVKNRRIEHYVRKLIEAIPVIGPINIQCFDDGEAVRFIEVNPRFGGGTALGMNATENWINLIVDNLINHKSIEARPTRYGVRMLRYYAECFVS